MDHSDFGDKITRSNLKSRINQKLINVFRLHIVSNAYPQIQLKGATILPKKPHCVIVQLDKLEEHNQSTSES